jgi:hypothetical protein
MNRWTGVQRSVLITSIALAVSAAFAGPALAIPPIIEDAARALPEVTRVAPRLSPTVELAPLRATEYGLPADEPAVATLDSVKADEVELVDQTAGQVTRDSESEALLKECVKNAMKSAAHDYFDATLHGTTPPNFDESFYYVVQGCLSARFPNAPSDVVDAVASYLTGHTDQAAREAVDASQPAFANWLSVTGDAVTDSSSSSQRPPAFNTPPAPPPATDTSPPDGGSSALWWGVGIAAVVLLAVAFGRSRRGS